MQSRRTSLPDAVKAILEVLRTEANLSVTALSRETKLNRRTVEKALKLLLHIPENTRRLVIRTVYYPNPSKDEIVLVHMLLNNALSPQKSLSLERDQTIQKLVKQGQIIEENGRLYLSDEGKIVAQGALTLYPELRTPNGATEKCQTVKS